MPAEPARGRTTRSLHSWLAFLSGDDDNLKKETPEGPKDVRAVAAREFDLTTKKFVEGGFETTKAEKCDVGFRTRDEVINHDVLIIITR